MKRTAPLSRVYQLLEPGPVVLLTTARKGRPNVMTMSWHTMMEFEPPLVGCVVSDRNFTLRHPEGDEGVRDQDPTVELAKKVVGCGNVSGRAAEKFATFRLTPAPASRLRSSPSATPASNAG